MAKSTSVIPVSYTHLKCGCEIIYTKKKGNHIDLMNLMQCLGNMQIDSLLLEGGSAMNWSALEQQIVYEVQVYIAPKIFGRRDVYKRQGEAW